MPSTRDFYDGDASAAVILLIKEAISRREWWGARTALTGLTCLVLLGVLIFHLIALPAVPGELPTEPSFDRAPGMVDVFCAILWAVDAIFVHSQQLSRRVDGALAAPLATLLIAGAAYSAIVALYQRSPAVFFSGEDLELSWRKSPCFWRRFECPIGRLRGPLTHDTFRAACRN